MKLVTLESWRTYCFTVVHMIFSLFSILHVNSMGTCSTTIHNLCLLVFWKRRSVQMKLYKENYSIVRYLPKSVYETAEMDSQFWTIISPPLADANSKKRPACFWVFCRLLHLIENTFLNRKKNCVKKRIFSKLYFHTAKISATQALFQILLICK